MTDKEKYDFIDHVVHLTLFEEDKLLNEHGGDYSGLKEDGIDSNEYYRIITERVINTLKKNNYMQEEPVSEDMWEVSKQYALRQVLASTDTEMSEQAYLDLRLFSGLELAIAHKDGAEWQKEQMMANVIDGLWIRRNRYTKINVLQNFDTTHAVFQQFKNGDKVKMVLIKED